jgi:hypothetical protein
MVAFFCLVTSLLAAAVGGCPPDTAHAATTGCVGGTVRILPGDSPAPYASVVIVGARLGTLTDSSGAFLIRGVPVGRAVVATTAPPA